MFARFFRLCALALLPAFVFSATGLAHAGTVVNGPQRQGPPKPKRKAPGWAGYKRISSTYSTSQRTQTVVIRHSNNSRDQVISMIYDKNLVVNIYDKRSKKLKFTFRYNSNKVNKVNILPAEHVDLKYTIPITQEQANWMKNNANTISVSMDFQVKHHRL